MKSGLKPGGFTIVETMIVLAVSAGILVSALTLLGGAQNKTQFSQAINDINQQISDVASTVANGYYNSSIVNQKCTSLPGSGQKPTFSTPGATTFDLGTNAGCVFIGRAVQFTDGKDFYIHNIVGRQRAGTPATEVTSMALTNAQIIQKSALTNPGYPSTTETKQLKNGLTPAFMKSSDDGTTWYDTPAVVFTSTLAANSSSNNDLRSGGQSIDFGPAYFSPAMSISGAATFIDRFDSITTGFAPQYDAHKNPPKGIVICFNSGTTNQHGVIQVGGAGRRSTTSLLIKDGKCAPSDLP